MSWRIIEGDALERLRGLASGSVQCCITSPPYYGLRNYGDDGQIGIEATPDEYVARLVEVFREVRRVLRDDGTLWLNIGDSYAGTWGNQGRKTERGSQRPINGGMLTPVLDGRYPAKASNTGTIPEGASYKAKDLLGIPWMLAEALRDPYYTGTIRDERDRIWLAAMIDAEGCMFIHKRKIGQSNGQGYVRKADSYGAGLEVSSTDAAIVENVLRIVGRGSICSQSPEQNDRRKQTLYRWNLRSNECREVIREVYPYLVAKQYEARLVLGCPSSGPDAERAHESLKAIHQGGTPDIDFVAPEPMFQRGWFLRSDIVWSKKPNPMPESVTDRPTSAHEHVFLLAKSRTYLYDADAIREESQDRAPWSIGSDKQGQTGMETQTTSAGRRFTGFNARYTRALADGTTPAGRSRRNVWEIATQPYPEAHFATFPTKLVEPMVLAGSSPKACGVCGAPWKRVVERGVSPTDPGRSATSKVQSDDPSLVSAASLAARTATRRLGQAYQDQLDANPLLTTGWQSSCSHNDDTGRCVVLDPFAGSGTVGVVARWHGRDFLGVELNAEYVGMAERRIASEGVLGRRARRDCRDDGHPSLFDDGEGLVLGAG